MENREMIKELLKELVTEETIDAAISEAVSERMNRVIAGKIEEEARRIVDERAISSIKERVDEVFEHPVKKDDGWGDVEYFESFESFVKDRVSDRVRKDYRFKDTVDRIVQDKMDGVIKRVSKELSQNVVADAVLAEMAKEV